MIRRGWLPIPARAAALALLLAVPGCLREAAEMPAPTRPAAEVIAAHADSLMAIPGVVGVAESVDRQGRTVLVVMLAERSRRTVARLPRQIEGYRVTVEVTGRFRPM